MRIHYVCVYINIYLNYTRKLLWWRWVENIQYVEDCVLNILLFEVTIIYMNEETESSNIIYMGGVFLC